MCYDRTHPADATHANNAESKANLGAAHSLVSDGRASGDPLASTKRALSGGRASEGCEDEDNLAVGRIVSEHTAGEKRQENSLRGRR
jgi:hypothetical protein